MNGGFVGDGALLLSLKSGVLNIFLSMIILLIMNQQELHTLNRIQNMQQQISAKNKIKASTHGLTFDDKSQVKSLKFQQSIQKFDNFMQIEPQYDIQQQINAEKSEKNSQNDHSLSEDEPIQEIHQEFQEQNHKNQQNDIQIQCSYGKYDGLTDEQLHEQCKLMKNQIKRLQQQCNKLIQNESSKEINTCTQQVQDIQANITKEISLVKNEIYEMNHEIPRIHREIKRMQEYLLDPEESQKSLFIKCNKLKRQIQQRNQKFSKLVNQLELADMKYADLLFKMEEINKKIESEGFSMDFVVTTVHGSKGVKNLEKKFKDLTKKKQSQSKRNTLAVHQIQNNCNTVARNILELRKQNSELSTKIKKIEDKSSFIHGQNDILMQNFNASKMQKQKDANETKLKYINVKNRRSKQKQVSLSLNQSKISNKKEKYRINTEQDDKLNKDLEDSQQIEGNKLVSNKLGQSSTSHTLRPNFKLRPTKYFNPVAMSKKIINSNDNASMEIRISHSPKFKMESPAISTTERLKRIEQIQIQKHSPNSNSQYNTRILKDLERNKKSKSQIRKFQHQKLKQSPTIQVSKLNISPLPLKLRSFLESLQGDDKSNSQTFLNSSNETISIRSQKTGNSYFKKRKVVKQKKMSDQYMRILQQKGRKILELDEQGQA